MYRQIAQALLATSLLCGCAEREVWVHDPPVSHQQMSRDNARCNVMASQASAGADGLWGLAMFKQEKDMCLEGEGWTKQSAN